LRSEAAPPAECERDRRRCVGGGVDELIELGRGEPYFVAITLLVLPEVHASGSADASDRTFPMMTDAKNTTSVAIAAMPRMYPNV